MNVLGRCCSAICVYKIFMSSINLLLRRGSAQAEDPATRLLTILLLNLRVPVDVSYWAPMLSLIFVGYLDLGKHSTVYSKIAGHFQDGLHLRDVELLGVVVVRSHGHVLCCMCHSDTSLRFQNEIELICWQMVGEVDLSSVHLHFDYVFLLSSLCSLAVFGLSYWLKGPCYRHPSCGLGKKSKAERFHSPENVHFIIFTFDFSWVITWYQSLPNLCFKNIAQVAFGRPIPSIQQR